MGIFSFFGGKEEPKALLPVAQARLAPFARVLVLGMDGLDPVSMERMMAAGELPNFSKLAGLGGYKRLQTSNPPESPVAWSTIATGCDPGEHGIFDFLHRDPQNYLPFLSLRKARQAFTGTQYQKARLRDGFWAYTSAAEIPTTVIRWPVAFAHPHGPRQAGLPVYLPGLLRGGIGRAAWTIPHPGHARAGASVEPPALRIRALSRGMQSRER